MTCEPFASRKANEMLIETIRRILDPCNDVVAVYLFGSVAEGQAHAQSDIDIAVLYTPEPSRTRLFQLNLEIGSRLEDALRGPIDVVNLNNAPPLLAFQVLQTGQLILEHNRTQRCIFQMHAMNRYYDSRRYLEEQRTAAIRRIREGGLGRGYRGHRNALAEARRLRAALAETPTSVN